MSAIPESERPYISNVERPYLMVCSECKKRCARERAGAEYQGEALCNNCGHTWNIGFRLVPGY